MVYFAFLLIYTSIGYKQLFLYINPPFSDSKLKKHEDNESRHATAVINLLIFCHLKIIFITILNF